MVFVVCHCTAGHQHPGAPRRLAADPGFPRRRIIDARLALSLLHHGVEVLYTRNKRDFEGFDFEEVIDPFEALA